ncbi:MAG: alkaline phosphatase family protein [Bacteroidia bacterium]|nr:alkaline phosphatase family protein [Bacteroidia bacterium]
MTEKTYTPDAQGSLGLLALGYRGLEAWRKARGQENPFYSLAKHNGAKGKRKVILLGWDAADWKIINPLLESGKMPALASLIKRGCSGHIATMDPPLSPMLWTSIASGHTADKHGILGFIEPNPDGSGVRPIQVTSRKVKAVWNILQQNGYKSHVVGWWPGFPAEPIDGVYVSNLYAKVSPKNKDDWQMAAGMVHPPELNGLMEWLRVRPEELTAAHIAPFVPQMHLVDQANDPALTAVARLVAAGASFHNAATWILENEEWDFLALYLNEIDVFSHTFMKFHPPKQDHIEEAKYNLYRNVMNAAYQWHDMMLGRILDLIGDDTTVILLSDHGFHSDQLRLEKLPVDPVAPAQEHAPYGVFVAAGPQLQNEQTIFGCSVADVTPTVPQIFGLPSGADMYGKVIAHAFENYAPLQSIPSWEEVKGNTGQHSGNFQIDTWASQIAMEQLAELGYVDSPDQKNKDQLKNAVLDSKYFLSRVYTSTGRNAEAMPVLKEIVSEAPDVARYSLKLLNTYIQLNEVTAARELFERIKDERRDPKFSGQLKYLEGIVLLAEGRLNPALEKMKEATAEAEELYVVHSFIGQIYVRLRMWEEARSSFIHALSLDSENADAHCGLALACLRLGDADTAIEEALAAVELKYFFPAAHYTLGEALLAKNEPEHAAEAFKVAATQRPMHKRAHQRLTQVYEQLPDKKSEAEHHRKIAAQYKNDHIIVVSGLPRSGTSMMMNMLKAGGIEVMEDGKRMSDESNPRGYFEDERVKALHLDQSWIGAAKGKAIKVVAPLLHFLPARYNYTVIFMDRDMTEVLRSQQIMLGKNPENFPMGLATAYAQNLRKAENWMSAQPHVNFLRVNYAEAIANPQLVAEQITEVLGQELNIEKMTAAVDASLYRNKKSH